jgi:hypothetical protein
LGISERAFAMITKSQPPEVTLRLWAQHLDSITEQRVTQPFSDVLADGLIWRDETIDSTPIEVIWSLRLLWHHRTGIIIGEQRRFADTWQLARELFPHWVGFHPDRCRPSAELAELYASSKTRKRGLG